MHFFLVLSLSLHHIALFSPNNVKIKGNDVFDLDRNSLSLSKENFAQNVLDKTVPFDNMDFSAFYSVFDRLKKS